MIPFAWFDRVTPYLDQIITILLSVIMIQTPVRTVITGIRDLMLIPPEEETIEDIKKTVEPIIGIYGHKNLYYDIVRTGRKLWISVYITFDKDIVSLAKFKHLQDKCIKALAQKYPDFYFELLPDITHRNSPKNKTQFKKGQVSAVGDGVFFENPVPNWKKEVLYTQHVQ